MSKKRIIINSDDAQYLHTLIEIDKKFHMQWWNKLSIEEKNKTEYIDFQRYGSLIEAVESWVE